VQVSVDRQDFHSNAADGMRLPVVVRGQVECKPGEDRACLPHSLNHRLSDRVLRVDVSAFGANP
jgi:hypothetical protein